MGLVSETLVLEPDFAIKRGLEFIYRTACAPENFDLYGYDYLGCFHCIATTSRDLSLRRLAKRWGRELAQKWRSQHTEVSPDADADEVALLVFGSYAAAGLGIPDSLFRDKLRKAASRFGPLDYFGFDTATEAPPADVPEDCDCGYGNRRGRKRCSHCRKPLSMISRYGVWVDALTRTYTGDRYGIRLGASFADVIKWLPVMRPYPNGDPNDPDFFWAIYAVTHIVYTLNDYSRYQLSPRWLPIEHAFLKRNLKQAIAMQDPETMGEFLDALKSFGRAEDHSLIRMGVDYLLATQNQDGSWGDIEVDDIYRRHHPTWTAIDGLREYRWQGKRLSFPELQSLLKAWAEDQDVGLADR